MLKRIILVFGLLSGCCPAAELSLPTVFSDHMVLQRDMDVPVWGKADPGAVVTVEFAGQKKCAVTSESGKWQVELDPMPASSESRVFMVSCNHQSEIINQLFSDVLVGEVWLCGGQSNMDFALERFQGNCRDPQYQPLADYIRKEIATANDPLFRQFKVERKGAPCAEQRMANGSWALAVSGHVDQFSATGYFFGRELRREMDVPVALLSCNWGGTFVEAWMPMAAFQQKNSFRSYYEREMAKLKRQMDVWDADTAKVENDAAMEQWNAAVAKARAERKRPPSRPPLKEDPALSRYIPASLYNGIVHSLVPYAVKGVIWYQGESNARRGMSEEYGDRFGAMITAWRERWSRPDLPFYWCQLAGFGEPNPEPVETDYWASICDQQRLTLALPNTGMAVLHDIGQAKDIHPKNKMDAGKRLALWAFHDLYGKDVVCSGPLYKSARVEGNKMIITFGQVGAGLMVGKKHLMDPTVEVDEPLKRFQICGADHQWKWAEAKITGKNAVEVWHPEIPEPVEVRYAWAQNPEGANLYNREGLPASIFKTN